MRQLVAVLSKAEHTLRPISRSVVNRALFGPVSIPASNSIRPRIFAPFRTKSGDPRMMVASAAARVGESSCFPKVSRTLQSLVEPASSDSVIAIDIVTKSSCGDWLKSQSDVVKTWVAAQGFEGKDGEILHLPGAHGGIERIIAGVDDASEVWWYATLSSKLPRGIYHLNVEDANHSTAALGWALGTYSFDRYKSNKASKVTANGESKCDTQIKARLIWPSVADRSLVTALLEGFSLARDMITTPAEDMAPQDIAAEARQLAAAHGATINVIAGDDLLKEGYPAVHMVGRASVNPPHLVDFRWTPSSVSDSATLPKLTLVGKGVTFDTGGLDLKPASGMKLMKKDMGGSALVLALAHAIMSTGLPVALRVLIPTVENSVSGNAYHPLDVLNTRAGITVENGNTDAEGRLILCDALAEAIREQPDLVIDAATLTGAARVALGTELPALFCNDDTVAEEILRAGMDTNDHLWRLPLHKPYRKMLDSKVADIYSCSEGGYAGAITAALFLQEFVKGAKSWVHIDTMAYNTSSKPGRPEGGEAFGLRALLLFLWRRYGAETQ